MTKLKGARRYGQCTRYLAGLKIGQKVTVSIKPSVMKVRPCQGFAIVVKAVDISIAILASRRKHAAPHYGGIRNGCRTVPGIFTASCPARVSGCPARPRVLLLRVSSSISRIFVR